MDPAQELAVKNLIKQEMTPTVNAASVKLPPFWLQNPAGFFTYIESQFSTNNIKSQDTKYHYLIQSLDAGIIDQISGFLNKTPVEPTKYDDLKAYLCRVFGRTREQMTAELINIHSIGDARPSAHLRRLQRLAPPDCGDIMMAALFMSHCPAYIRQAISTVQWKTVEELAAWADKVFDNCIGTAVSSLSATTHHDVSTIPPPTAFRDNTVVDAIRSDGRRDQSRRRRQKPQQPSKTGTLCYYHDRFGARANKCVKGCLMNKHFSGNA